MSNRWLNWLQNFYLLLLIILFSLIILTPYLIKDGISIFEEETVEVATLIVLIPVTLIIYRLYQRELAKNKERLAEAVDYLGKINVQIENLQAAFQDINKYPETKSDLKYILDNLADKILGIINSDWVFIRVIELNTLKTLTEYCKARGKAVLFKCEISNKLLVSGGKIEDYFVVGSTAKNFNIRTFCVIPVKSLSQSQEFFLKSIIDNISMFYLIFASGYYKNSRLNNNYAN